MSPGSSKVWHSRLERADSWWFSVEQELVAMRVYSQFSQEGVSGSAPAPGHLAGWAVPCGGPANPCPFCQAPMAVQRTTEAVPSSACPTLQGGCAAVPLATTWCGGWHALWHCPARLRSRPALTTRAASLESRSVMGIPTALMAPTSLTVSACPQLGCAGVLAGRRGDRPDLPTVCEWGSHLGLC